MSLQALSQREQFRSLDRLARLLEELSKKWEPHPKQVEAIAAILWGGAKYLALEWGRRTGKGDAFVALFGLWGQLFHDSQSYIFGPERKEMERIYWVSNKIEDTLPGNWIDEMNSSKLMVYWAGSTRSTETGKMKGWLIIDGADNHDATRGIEPKRGILGLDEVREMSRDLWNTIEPILLRWDSPVALASTPPDELQDEDDPDKPNWMLQLFDSIKDRADGVYIHATSYQNPHIKAARIDEKRKELEEKGELDVFEREYLAMRTPKKTGRRFGLLDKRRHQRPHADVMRELEYQHDLCKWFCITDPAGASVWAWNMMAIHDITKKVYVLDEMDEKDQSRMVTDILWPEAERKVLELHKDFEDWDLRYDEAEAWFAREVSKFDGVSFSGCLKQTTSEEEGFSLIKGLLLAEDIVFSDRCKHTWWEFENYENEKSRHHHIDIIRYLLIVSGYTPKRDPAPKTVSGVLRPRGITIAQDLREAQKARDWTHGIV